MSSKTIEIIIDRQGQTKVETKGFAGGECRAASAELEKALGKVESDKPTTEAYLSQSETERSRLKSE